MHQQGDAITRTTASGHEMILLPGIDLAHLKQVKVVGTRLAGFHVLPATTVVKGLTPITLPVGAVPVVDQQGSSIPGAWIRIVPRKAPQSDHDTLEALVEVVASTTGIVLASSSQKTFWPVAWSDGQIEQAIYAALVQAYQANRVPLGLVWGVTPEGVTVELAVQGNISAAGTRLTLIAMAHPRPGQQLVAAHQP
jgi:hypothetical protein